MGKDKLRRFKENQTLKNIIQPSREDILNGFIYKGNWNKLVFKNSNPIVLELGCGKGEYSVGLSKIFPEKNFIGIDIKGARFWKGAKIAIEEKIYNVYFLRTQIELIDYIFEQDEVDEIWLTFPDPQIKYKRSKHRLTNQIFLSKYKKIIKPSGSIHLKTDSEFLYGYTNGLIQGLGYEIISSHHDIYGAPEFELADYIRNIKTHYEQLFINEGKKITYTNFRL